jgi:hypothetical protein
MDEKNKRSVERWTWAMVGLFLGAVVGYLVITILLTGCGLLNNDTAGCESQTIRCAGEVLQVCNADGAWETITDCATVTPETWVCCPAQETCVPTGECVADHLADGGNMIDGGDR